MFDFIEEHFCDSPDKSHATGPVSKELAEAARLAAAEVTRYQIGGAISSRDGMRIVHIFSEIYRKYGIIGLEETKNEIGDERDKYDMTDLIKQLRPPDATALQIMFKKPYVLSPRGNTLRGTPYEIKVLSDVDNTAIEALRIAAGPYSDGNIIPGFLPIIEVLSCGATTTTFISARPRTLELKSINMMSKKINEYSENGGVKIRFSFATGTMMSLVELAAAEAIGTAFEYIRRDALKNSYRKLAELKYKNYEKVAAIYPDCRFVFFGDDTQGDAVFAHELVKRDPLAIAIIRRLSVNPIAECHKHKRIIYHTSYYEVAYRIAGMPEFSTAAGGKFAEKVLKAMAQERFTHEVKTNPAQSRRDQMYINAIQNIIAFT